MVKKAIEKLKDELSEEQYFLEDNPEGEDWLSQAEGQLAVDVYQTENDVVIKAPIAGVDPDDIDITVQGDQVTIRGERKEEKEVNEENYHAHECYWGAFSRSIVLPTEVDFDKAKVTFKNGILNIRLPKSGRHTLKKLQINKD